MRSSVLIWLSIVATYALIGVIAWMFLGIPGLIGMGMGLIAAWASLWAIGAFDRDTQKGRPRTWTETDSNYFPKVDISSGDPLWTSGYSGDLTMPLPRVYETPIGEEDTNV